MREGERKRDDYRRLKRDEDDSKGDEDDVDDDKVDDDEIAEARRPKSIVDENDSNCMPRSRTSSKLKLKSSNSK